MEEIRWGAVSLDNGWSIPMIDADFLRFALKNVEHSRYLPIIRRFGRAILVKENLAK